MSETVADRLAALTYDAGLQHIYGLPGGENVALLEACRRRGHRFVLTHHEASAIFMASAAAQLNRRPALCLTTLGPGAANAVAGLAHAYLDRSPIILITAVSVNDGHDAHSHQRLDLHALFEPITKASLAITTGNVNETFQTALQLCHAGRPGPVHLGLPANIALEPVAKEQIAHPQYIFKDIPPANDALASRIESTVSRSKRPVIVVGLGLEPEAPYDALRQLAERVGAPIITTPKAKGALAADHLLASGTIGLSHDDPAYQILEKSDLILAVGLDVVELVRPWRQKAPLIWLSRWTNAQPRIPTIAEWIGPLTPILNYLSQRADPIDSDWAQVLREMFASQSTDSTCQADVPDRIHPEKALAAIREHTPEDTIVATDVGAHKILSALKWPAYRPNSYLVSNGLSCMGFGLPAAIASGMAQPEKVTLALIGDGGLAMSLGELRLLAELDSTVIVYVFRDDSLELIRSKQAQRDMPAYGTTFNGPQLDHISAAYGLDFYRAKSAAQCAAVTKAAVANGRPALVEIVINAAGY